MPQKQDSKTSISKGDMIIFPRNGKTRVGKIISKGPKYLGLEVLDMKSKTRIEHEEHNLVPMTVLVDQSVLED